MADSLCVQCRTQAVSRVWKPFCSERCKLLDLGAWADETHTIPGDAAHDAVSEGLQPDGR